MQTIKYVEINALRGVDPDDIHLACYMPYTYLMSEELDKWTQSHDGGRRYGAMTTNISDDVPHSVVHHWRLLGEL